MFGIPGNKREEQIDIMVSHLEDINDTYASEQSLGRKGLSLYRLHSFDVPISDLFIISPQIFSEFVKKVLESKSGEDLLKDKNPEPREILNVFHKFDFEDDIKREILKEYTKLSGFSDAWVSVRSSTSAPTYPEVSFSGVFSTELNVRGFNNLLKSIKSVYASMFTDSAVMYAVREGVELADVKLGIVVQKMVHAEVSGTCFTLDPVTLSQENLSLEAVYGLGDVISLGEITPDTYQLRKRNLEILEKHISPQDWMKIQSLNSDKGGFEKISISSTWSHRQKLEDKYIQEVSKISLVIEDKVGDSVDVEWVLSGGRIYVLQYKPAYTKQSYLSHHVQFGGYSYVANTVGQVLSELSTRNVQKNEMIENSMHQAQMLVEKQNEKSVPQEIETKVEVAPTPLIQSLTSGIGVSFGQVKGVAKIVSGPLDVVDKGNVLAIKDFDSSLSPLVLKSSGVLSVGGGLTSELAILCREFGIPAIVGIADLLEKVNDGDTVEIDGNSGSVYMIDRAKMQQLEVAREIVAKKQEAEFVTAKLESKMEQTTEMPTIMTATKIFVDGNTNEFVSNADGVMFVDMDKVILSYGKHPSDVVADGGYKKYAQEVIAPIVTVASSYSPREVVVVIGKGTVNEFKKIGKDESCENQELSGNVKGVSRYLSNKKALDVVVRLIKRIRNIHGLRNVSIGVYQPQGGNLMREIKKEISARGLRRGSSFNIYAVFENPAEVIMCEDILDAEIDGIVIDTPTLARHVFSLPLTGKDVVYDLSSNSIFRIIDSISQSTKAKGKRFVVFVEDNKDLVKYCVSKGVYGIVVPPVYINTAKKLVSDQETKIILSVK
jgi:pyruvate,water dikinase